MLSRSLPVLLLAATATVLALAAPAAAGPYTATAPLDISAGNPLLACPPDGFGINFLDAEVEPFVDVNPTDPDTSSRCTSRTATTTAAPRATSPAPASTAA